MLVVEALDHIVLNVSDVETTATWYERVLGMKREAFVPRDGDSPRTALTFGRQKINVRPVDASIETWFTGQRPCAGSDDLCFLTTSDPLQVVAHLHACGVAVEQGPVAKTGARGTLISVYCRDPDGNLIEISSYESERT